jgi:hypothetical protein
VLDLRARVGEKVRPENFVEDENRVSALLAIAAARRIKASHRRRWRVAVGQSVFRDYDPATGRYVQSDPIGLGAGLSTYNYVGANSFRRSDQKGLIAFGSTCDAQMRVAILQAITELSNEFSGKAGSTPNGCEKGSCDSALARDAMKNVARMTFSCNNSFPCAQTLVNGLAYFYPPLLRAPKASNILNPGQCGCLKGVIFHEATHQARTDMDEDQVRRETLSCVSCAQNVDQHGGRL